jgi:hypothetical protein
MPNPANKSACQPLVFAHAASLLAVGVPYWLTPSAQLSLPASLYGLGLAVVFAAALAVCWGVKATVLRSTLVIAAAVPAAVFLRVVVEVLLDPNTHNLWPFEIAIAVMVGLPVAFTGALTGKAYAVLLRRGV